MQILCMIKTINLNNTDLFRSLNVFSSCFRPGLPGLHALTSPFFMLSDIPLVDFVRHV
jgi:hypothetical protein